MVLHCCDGQALTLIFSIFSQSGCDFLFFFFLLFIERSSLVVSTGEFGPPPCIRASNSYWSRTTVSQDVQTCFPAQVGLR